ncbi:MAG TPA: hypothetical protein VK824_05875 [Planctomycetota bacterium]|nr:hypothetical protein [Planctomycetota bacterium]
MSLVSSRSCVVFALFLALWAAPPARAGDVVQVQVGKTFALKFDLGFKLPCKHEYQITYDVPDVLEQVKPPLLTSSTTFKFKALKTGTVEVMAAFTGPGGNCVGSAMATLQVQVDPDPKATEKIWKTFVKAADKSFGGTLKDMGKDFGSDVDAILGGFALGALDSGDAALALFDAAEQAETDAAFAAHKAMRILSDIGTGALDAGGLTAPLPSFQDGAPGSLWTDFTYDVREDYDDFVDDVYDEIDDALAVIAKERGTFSYTTFVDSTYPFSLPAGPGIATDPDDVSSAPARILGGIAWSDSGAGKFRYFGTGLLSSGDVSVDITGPAGASPLDQVISQTEISTGSDFGKWALSGNGLSIAGQYRFDVRYDDDAHVAQKVVITLPGAP